MSKQKSEYCLKLWLKYKPECARTPDGTVTIPKYFGATDRGTKEGHYRRMMKHIAKRRDEGKIWQAKIYEHPGNIIRFEWREDQDNTSELLSALALITTDELEASETLNVQATWKQKS